MKTWILGLLTMTLMAPLLVFAAGGGGDSSSSGSSSSAASAPRVDRNWVRAKEMVEQAEYRDAIPLLQRVVRSDSENADAYNLLGFTHRKTGQLDAALKYYKKALGLNRKHRGAHEYIGEAYLEMGDLAKARAHLAKLDDICFFSCKEQEMLKKAIEKYESRTE